MDELSELVMKLLLLIGSLFYLLVILLVIVISVVYVAGYVYDSIFGNALLKLGYYFRKRNPEIEKIIVLKKLWKQIRMKEVYLRYETPLFTYCFSYTAISLIAVSLPVPNGIGLIIASGLYLALYFIGMFRKCGNDEQYYEKVLSNNIEFLKLSFLPLGFIITVLGFCFTITGMKLQEIPVDFLVVENMLETIKNYSDETNILMFLLKQLIQCVLLLMFFYIVSLPIQVISYFIISGINYFRKYKRAYVTLFKKYFGIVVRLIKQ